MASFDPILTKILWSRLTSIVDEAATGLMRASYSVVVRDYYDFSIGLFDGKGTMLVHSTLSTPAFIGMMPNLMKHLLARHPIETLKEGDVLITNNCWIATGHTLDITVAEPIFDAGKIVGFSACTVHHLDIGGRRACLDSLDMYEEGLHIPIVKLYEGGRRNDVVYEFIRPNVRVSTKVLGDLNAQIASTSICGARLLQMMKEYKFSDLETLSATIIDLSRRSMEASIRALPNGVYRSEFMVPPIGPLKDHIKLAVAVHIKDESIVIDYDGSAPQVAAAVNVTLPYTTSYSTYPIKLALDPDVPNNAGCLAPITVVAPEGSVVNSLPPAPMWGRLMIGHFLPELVMSALPSQMADKIIASSGSTPMTGLYFSGRKADGEHFLSISTHMGGMGASARQDGSTCLGFPFNVASIPIEIVEIETCLYYKRKEFTTDSAGPGKHRGGFGQTYEIAIADGDMTPMGPITASLRGSPRTPDSQAPALGRQGGGSGRKACISLNNEAIPHGKIHMLQPGDVVHVELPGGGGYGNPFERDLESVRADVEAGLVSLESAESEYGVAFLPGAAEIDQDATAALRRNRTAEG